MVYLQVVMLYHLVNRYFTPWLSLIVECVVVSSNVGDVSREVCSKVCNKVGRLNCIVLLACT